MRYDGLGQGSLPGGGQLQGDWGSQVPSMAHGARCSLSTSNRRKSRLGFSLARTPGFFRIVAETIAMYYR